MDVLMFLIDLNKGRGKLFKGMEKVINMIVCKI